MRARHSRSLGPGAEGIRPRVRVLWFILAAVLPPICVLVAGIVLNEPASVWIVAPDWTGDTTFDDLLARRESTEPSDARLVVAVDVAQGEQPNSRLPPPKRRELIRRFVDLPGAAVVVTPGDYDQGAAGQAAQRFVLPRQDVSSGVSAPEFGRACAPASPAEPQSVEADSVPGRTVTPGNLFLRDTLVAGPWSIPAVESIQVYCARRELSFYPLTFCPPGEWVWVHPISAAGFLASSAPNCGPPVEIRAWRRFGTMAHSRPRAGRQSPRFELWGALSDSDRHRSGLFDAAGVRVHAWAFLNHFRPIPPAVAWLWPLSAAVVCAGAAWRRTLAFAGIPLAGAAVLLALGFHPLIFVAPLLAAGSIVLVDNAVPRGAVKIRPAEYDVFVGHDQWGRDKAASLTRLLETELGRDRVFFDRHALPGSGDYAKKIRAALSGAQVYVFFWCVGEEPSQFLADEIARAIDYRSKDPSGKRILLVCVDRLPTRDIEKPYGLALDTAVDGTQDGWEDLVVGLVWHHVCGPAGLGLQSTHARGSDPAAQLNELEPERSEGPIDGVE